MLLAIRFGDVAKERGILPYRQVCSSFALSCRCLEVALVLFIRSYRNDFVADQC